MHPSKKLFFLLFAVLTVTIFLFSRELKRTFNITTAPDSKPIVSDGMADIALDKNDFVLGNQGAALNIIMFGDLSCAKCQTVYYEIAKTVRAHPQDMRLIWKSAPLGGIFTKGNFLPHQAAYCAGQQGKFWPFIEMAMTDKYNFTANGLKKVAEGLPLNTPQWWQCTNSEEAKNKINDSVEQLSALGIKELPAVFVNNRLLNTEAKINLEEMLLSFIKK
jgi:protein-disulfide isomerase